VWHRGVGSVARPEPARLCHNGDVPSTPGFRPVAIKITCGEEAAERANQAWTVAATAIASGAEVTVWLTGEAVWFAVVGRQPDLGLQHATPATELIETVRASGRIVVCTQCAARRELTLGDLIEGATIAGAATFVEAVLGPQTQALVY
jgi:predicted peroxiredoxin